MDMNYRLSNVKPLKSIRHRLRRPAIPNSLNQRPNSPRIFANGILVGAYNPYPTAQNGRLHRKNR
jgi:hypothetical protein